MQNGYGQHPLPESQNNSAFRVVNDRGENLDSIEHDLRKSDSGSIHSDKHVAEWTEGQRGPRDFQPYQSGNRGDSSLTNRPKSCPPPVKPKPVIGSKIRSNNIKEIKLSQNINEGFGFVIMSNPSSNGSVIERIVPDSPSARSSLLTKDDKLLEVNGHDVSKMSHSEIVSMVKNSGLQVKLGIESVNLNSVQIEPSNEPPPPRPAEPMNYRPINYNSYNRHEDNLRDDYIKQQQLANFQVSANISSICWPLFVFFNFLLSMHDKKGKNVDRPILVTLSSTHFKYNFCCIIDSEIS